MSTAKQTLWFLVASCAVVTILWLPGLWYYAPWNDTAVYALLGQSVLENGQYAVLGVPESKYLPLHALFSVPFVLLGGYKVGMALTTLVAGWGVLVAGYFLLQKLFSRPVAIGATILLTFHHAFVLMTQQGSADLLFTALFLASLLGYVLAKDDRRWYLLAGIAAGLACLTRYNGAPLFVLFLGFTYWKRPKHLRSPWFQWGMIVGAVLFGLWFVRNALVFGDPFHTDYTGELATHTRGFFSQIFSNVFYYADPVHNLLPVFFLAALYGLWKLRKTHVFAMLAMCSAWVLTAFWWVQAMRFAFPGYVILAGFAVAGFLAVAKQYRRRLVPFIVISTVLVVPMHAAALCLYSYGPCNAFMDRTVGILPKNLGLSPEGFWTWEQSRRFLNGKTSLKGTVVVDTPWNAAVWQELFRPDLRVTDEKTFSLRPSCPSYRITQKPNASHRPLFSTLDEPTTSVMESPCP